MHCKIYVDGCCSRRDLLEIVCASLNGQRDGWSVDFSEGDLDVRANDDADEGCFRDRSDGFLFSRYYLDIDKSADSDRTGYVEALSRLLDRLWTSGFVAVASCDFEDELPRLGGVRTWREMGG